MAVADIFWSLFVRTGSITAYLLYKRYQATGLKG